VEISLSASHHRQVITCIRWHILILKHRYAVAQSPFLGPKAPSLQSSWAYEGLCRASAHRVVRCVGRLATTALLLDGASISHTHRNLSLHSLCGPFSTAIQAHRWLLTRTIRGSFRTISITATDSQHPTSLTIIVVVKPLVQQ
jgi:hypothetical protein